MFHNRDFDLKTCQIGQVSILRGESWPLQRSRARRADIPSRCLKMPRRGPANHLSSKATQPERLPLHPPPGTLVWVCPMYGRRVRGAHATRPPLRGLQLSGSAWARELHHMPCTVAPIGYAVSRCSQTKADANAARALYAVRCRGRLPQNHPRLQRPPVQAPGPRHGVGHMFGSRWALCWLLLASGRYLGR